MDTMVPGENDAGKSIARRPRNFAFFLDQSTRMTGNNGPVQQTKDHIGWRVPLLPGESRQPLSPPAANIWAMRFTALKLNSLRDLLIEELRDLYSAETQLVGALPKMAEAAASQELASAFEHHLEETRGHVSRLESIFNQIGEKSSGETCEAMKGLIKEGEILVKAEGDPDVRDAGLIGAAQRVEHYEMAGYGTARSLARRLGENQTAEILQQTLDEEGEANKKLTSIAESQVNVAATSRA